jgi:hypothetical protein
MIYPFIASRIYLSCLNALKKIFSKQRNDVVMACFGQFRKTLLNSLGMSSSIIVFACTLMNGKPFNVVVLRYQHELM